MWFSRHDVPEADRLVVGAGGNGTAVRGPGEGVDAGKVAGEGLKQGEG